MNAVHGALQQVERMIKFDAEQGRDDGTQAETPADKPTLDIKPKEEAKLLNEGDK